MFKSIWSILGVFMMIPIIIINHVIPDSMIEEKTRVIVVLFLLAIQISSVLIFAMKQRKELKKLEAELQEERNLLDIKIKNLNK